MGPVGLANGDHKSQSQPVRKTRHLLNQALTISIWRHMHLGSRDRASNLYYGNMELAMLWADQLAC